MIARIKSRNDLTPREREVLRLACAGKVDKQIADELRCGLPTVKAHMQSIRQKFGVTNRVQAVLVAFGVYGVELDAVDNDPARLSRIRQIIEAVDNRCAAVDGPVTPTLKEMTQDEISAIYALACRKPEKWRPA